MIGNQKVLLKDVCSIHKGETPIKKAKPGEYPLVVTAEERASHDNFQFDCKAVIVPLVSSTGHGHASIKRIHYQEGRFALGSILCAVIPKDDSKLIPEFLFTYFSYFKDKLIVPLMKGTANVSLSIRALSNLEIIVPSLEVQKKIIQIAENDEHLRSLENEISNQKSLLAKLKQAILQEAIQGKLTADWRAANRDTEPASKLLERIKEEKARLIAEKKIKKEKPLPEITPEETPFAIPEGWEWTNLDTVSKFTNGKAHEQLVDPKGKFILINSRFVSTGGDTKKFAREVLTPLSVGAIVMVMSDVPNGRALARCFIIDKENRYTLNQRIGGFEMLGQIVPEFAHHLLDRNQYLLSFNDGKKQTNLKKRQILACPFPLPPLTEQAVIVERVDALMQTCRKLEDEIEQSSNHAADLLQAVLKEAFASAS